MDAVKCVLLDIEGTVCPISFVRDTLFPYAIQALPGVLAAQWDSDIFRPYRDAFPPEHRSSPEALQAHVEDLTQRDVKVAYLKNLQGYLWEDGYKSRTYSTELFPDVVPQLRTWKAGGLTLAIYSSGSVFAQRLLFGYVQTAERPAQGVSPQANAVRSAPPVEDLTPLFDGWFDTVNAGPKTEGSSYRSIAAALKYAPEQILFLSDNLREVDAAVQVSMRSILVDRPGNAPLSGVDAERLQVVKSFSEINWTKHSTATGMPA